MPNLDTDPFKLLEKEMPTDPRIDRIFQDIRDFNTMLELGEINFEPDPDSESKNQFFDEMRPLLEAFNGEWPYFNKEIPITSKVLRYREDRQVEDFDDDEYDTPPMEEVEVMISVENGSVISYGFAFRDIGEDQPVMGHMFAFDIVDDCVVTPQDPESPEFFGWSSIDDVVILTPNLEDEDPEEYLRFYLPRFMEEIDTRILNADNEVEAIEALRGLTFRHEKNKSTREQRSAMEGYLNKNIRPIKQIPYTLFCKGLVHILDNKGKIGSGMIQYPEKRKAWAVIEKVTMIAPLSKGKKRQKFLDQVSLPAIIAKIYEPDLSELEKDQYVRVVIPITDDLRIISNTDRLL